MSHASHMHPRESLAPTLSSSAHGLPTDVFDGFFVGPAHADAPDGDLLDHAAARHWLRLVEWGAHTGLYTYQLPLDGMSGAHVTVGGRRLLMLSSYDYLGLIGHPTVQQGAIDALHKHGTGTGGVRLLSGTVAIHRTLEREIADFKGTEAALVFTSGYMAALGVIGALLGPRDRVLLDERIHRSMIDACVLARVPFERFTHNDPAALDRTLRTGRPRGRTLVAIEGVYSMDGDTAPLGDIVGVARAHGAFTIVDEAHSLGTLGATGRGIDEHCGVAAANVDLWLGSLSKAIPSCGGFIAARRELIVYLQHGSAPFMFSSALSPAAAGAARAALGVLRREPWRVARAQENAAYLRQGLREHGFDLPQSSSCIIPVVLGSDKAAFRAARDLLDQAILTSAVIPPAVPRGSARLRLCATAAQSRADLEQALCAIRAVACRCRQGRGEPAQ